MGRDARTSWRDGNVLLVIGRTMGQKGTVRPVPFDRCEFYLNTHTHTPLWKTVMFQGGVEGARGGWNQGGRMSMMLRRVVGVQPTRVYSEDG